MKQSWITISIIINVVLVLFIVYVLHHNAVAHQPTMDVDVKVHRYESPSSQTNDTLNNPYAPPVKTDYVQRTQGLYDIRGAPNMTLAPSMNAFVNYPTRGFDTNYTQIGILKGTDINMSSTLLLPLMGRRILNGRDKLQYFTISNTGMINTKLPIRVKGRSCMNERGCDELSSGDRVFVEGYNEEFVATIYENATFSYVPI